jgi:hypothetical protein
MFAMKQNLRSQAVFLQMPLVVFKRARDVGVLEMSKTQGTRWIVDAVIREKVIWTCDHSFPDTSGY